jgi:hypothetical protein
MGKGYLFYFFTVFSGFTDINWIFIKWIFMNKFILSIFFNFKCQYYYKTRKNLFEKICFFTKLNELKFLRINSFYLYFFLILYKL